MKRVLGILLGLSACATRSNQPVRPASPATVAASRISGHVTGVHGAAKLEVWPTTDQVLTTDHLAWTFEVTSKIGGLSIGRPCSPLDLRPLDYFDAPRDLRTIELRADGAFTVALPAGDYALFAHGTGRSSVVRRVHVAGPSTAELELVATQPLSGIVLDGIGPVRSALCIGSPVANGCIARTVSDLWGRFSVDGAPLDALTVRVAVPDHDTTVGQVVRRGPHVVFALDTSERGGVVEGRVRALHGGVLELVVDGPQGRAEGDGGQGTFCPGCDGHALAVAAAAPLDDTGHYRLEHIRPGRYRALFVETGPTDIGGTSGDGIELLPGVIEVGTDPTLVPDLVPTSPHVVEVSARKETGAVAHGEAVGVFAGDDHARYLVGLFSLRDTARYAAHAGSWLWPSRPQTFYSGAAEWVTRYAKPVPVGAATSIDLEVDRRAVAPHSCAGE